MGRSRVIADIRRHNGDSRMVIGLVGSFALKEGADVEWLVRPDQAHLRPPGQIIGCTEQYDRSWSIQIRERITQYAQNDPGGSFWVLSYDPYVRTEAERLQLPNTRVTTISPAVLIAQASGVRKALSTTSGPVPSLQADPLTFDAAVQLAKQVLRQGDHSRRETALNLPFLRVKMAEMDSRANKRRGDTSSESLISKIVGAGAREGWLNCFQRTPGKSGTEAIFLCESVGSSSIPIPASVATEIPAPPAAEPATAEPQLAKKHPNRATGFERELSTARIGSMPQSRELIFNIVESALQKIEGEPPNLASLLADVTREAQRQASASGYVGEKNWPIAVKCVQRLMLRAGVLLDNKGISIPDQIGSTSRRVASLAPDFRRRCEAFLVAQIIQAVGGISYDDDLYYIGLTLYRRGRGRAVPPEELAAQADELLTYMDSEKMIEMGSDRMVRPRPRVLPPVPQMAETRTDSVPDLSLVPKVQRQASMN